MPIMEFSHDMSTSGKRVERWYSGLFDVVVMSTVFLPAAYVKEFPPKETSVAVISSFSTWANLLDSKFQIWIRPLTMEDWDGDRPRGSSGAQRCSSEVTECIHNSVYRYSPQWYLPFNHPLTILARWNLPTSQKTIYLSITLSRLIHHCGPW